uniref:Uncharacterized protein n=1 Tax=Glossina austeni TaxID=7395 RepID=A0A1A9UV65_GLOAU
MRKSQNVDSNNRHIIAIPALNCLRKVLNLISINSLMFALIYGFYAAKLKDKFTASCFSMYIFITNCSVVLDIAQAQPLPPPPPSSSSSSSPRTTLLHRNILTLSLGTDKLLNYIALPIEDVVALIAFFRLCNLCDCIKNAKHMRFLAMSQQRPVVVVVEIVPSAK